MRLKYRKDVKHCPRCNQKALLMQPKCSECGLIFERVDNATNAEAKKQFFQKDKALLMVKKTPKDVNRIKLILLCAFLGPFGAHNFYIGRYYKAIFMAIFGGFSLAYVVLQPYFVKLMFVVQYFLFIPIAFVGIFWILDFIKLVFEKYPIPVAIKNINVNSKVEIVNQFDKNKTEIVNQFDKNKGENKNKKKGKDKVKNINKNIK